MTPEQRKIHGAEAKQLLDNKHFKEAFEAVDDYLNAAALACSPDDAAKAQRIVISKQLLQAVKREIVRKIEDGEVAEVQISEIEQRRGLRKFLR
jgi:hypothetical protein